MTAIEIVKVRQKIPTDQAKVYVHLAELKAASRTGMTDFTEYPSEIADIAAYLYLEDLLREMDDTTGGVSSESYSEGGVSVSKTYGDITAKITEYENGIEQILKWLKARHTGRLRFL